MNDITNQRRFTAWLPLASLAISAAAFGLGAPARIARGFHRAPSIAVRSSADADMRDESALFPLKTLAAPLQGSWRVFHGSAGRQIAMTR